MIIPCMNFTSACDRGGSAPLVEGASVLLGFPGAPGCTTTGAALSVCCAHAAENASPAEQKKPVATPTARSRSHTILRRCPSIRFACGVSANPTLDCSYDENQAGGNRCAFSFRVFSRPS